MKKIMACLVIMAALTGCSKSDDQGGGLSTPENTLPKKNDDHGGKALPKGVFPKKIVHKAENGNISYEITNNVQGEKVLSTTSISYKRDGSIESKILISVSYEGDYPKEITYTESITNGEKKNYTETYSFVDGKLKTKYDNSDRATTTTYSYHNDGKLAKVLVEKPGKSTLNGQIIEKIYVTETDYTHTGNVITATEKRYFKDTQGNKLDGNTSLTTYTYTFENENLIKKTESTTDHETTIEYTYDGKNNPNLQNLRKLVNPDYFISTSGSKNNILTEKTTYKGNHNNASPYVSEYVYEYTYADNNYPLTEKVFRKRTENGLEKKELDHTTEYTY